jgi:hypothetical protein
MGLKNYEYYVRKGRPWYKIILGFLASHFGLFMACLVYAIAGQVFSLLKRPSLFPVTVYFKGKGEILRYKFGEVTTYRCRFLPTVRFTDPDISPTNSTCRQITDCDNSPTAIYSHMYGQCPDCYSLPVISLH